MSKLFFLCLIIGLLVSITVAITDWSRPTDAPDDKVYSGPVRPTDDEEYFRETGITKPKDKTE